MERKMKHRIEYRGKTLEATTEEELREKIRQLEHEEDDNA